MISLNELNDPDNSAAIESMTSEQVHKWYLHIKQSLPRLQQVGSTAEIESAICEYEQQNGIV